MILTRCSRLSKRTRKTCWTGFMIWQTWRWRKNRSACATISMLCAPATLQAPTASHGIALSQSRMGVMQEWQTKVPR